MKANYYINENGVKTSKKLDNIIDNAWNYLYGGKGYNSSKWETQKMQNLRIKFEAEVLNIGGVNYTFGDCLA
jgi:hypothetical protein